MKRLAIAFALTLPMTALCFLMGSIMNVRGVDLIGGTAIMSLLSMYLLWTENMQFTRKK